MVQAQLINKILATKSLDVVFENDLTPDHFVPYSDEFTFILEHYRNYGNVPDVETFLSNFKEFDIIAVTESDSYLINQINDEYQYRVFVPIIKHAAELLKGSSVDAIDYIRSAMAEVGAGVGNIGIDIISQAGVRLEEYKKKRDADKPWLMPTGFQELDAEIGGLSPGEEFVVIVARTNNGKSWVLCKMLEHNWKMGANVGYISPEMSASSIGYRFDTLLSHFSNYSLYTGRDIDGYEDHIRELASDPKHKFIVATPLDFNKKITVSKLRSFCLRNKLDILGIDGITYLSDERYRKGDNKTISLTNISEDLMSLSCELKIPIIAVVQANRNGIEENGDVPALESIRDSDGISHNATKVLSIRNCNKKLTMELTKSRNSRVGVKLVYDWQIDTGTFTFSAGDDDNQVSERGRAASNFPSRRQQPQPELNQPIRPKRNNPLPF